MVTSAMVAAAVVLGEEVKEEAAVMCVVEQHSGVMRGSRVAAAAAWAKVKVKTSAVVAQWESMGRPRRHCGGGGQRRQWCE